MGGGDTVNRLPEIGEKFYFVREHLYRKDRFNYNLPLLREFCVYEGEVYKLLTLEPPLHPEFVLLVNGQDIGANNIEYKRPGDIGKTVFYTPREAALLAKAETEKYERIWGWLGPPDIPLRRTWEKYLEVTAD